MKLPRWMFLGGLCLMAAACVTPAPTSVVVPPTHSPPSQPPLTATAPAPTATATPVPTDTPLWTATPIPSETLPPTETALPTDTPAPTVVPTAEGPMDYTPAASVWNFAQGPDQVAGTCSGPHLPPYGLAQIVPDAAGLTWRSQEIAPYVFSKIQTNVYAYSGPTAAGDGTVVMTLTFTSPTTLVMRRTFAPAAEPGCSHTHDYTGTFQWLSQ